MRSAIISFAIVGLFFVVGCSQESGKTAAPTPSAGGLKYILGQEPPKANDVIGARETAKSGEPVVVVGRIGGSANPWIENRAAFSIVDR